MELLNKAQIQAIDDSRIVGYSGCSALTFLLWDVLINLEQEVKYVWWGPNTWVKWMYLFIRHMPYLAEGSFLGILSFADNTRTAAQCRTSILYEFVANEVLMIAVEFVFVVRIYAMFNRNRPVVTAVWILFVAEIVATCTFFAVDISQVEFTPQCLITSTPRSFTLYWPISLAFETVLFVLTLVKFCMFFGETRRQSIMMRLMKDGTWAYAIIFAVMLLNTIMYNVEKNPLAGTFYFWVYSIMSFAGSHVLLNLRQLARSPGEDSLIASHPARVATPHWQSPPTLTDIQFVITEATHADTDTAIELQTISA